MRSCIRSCARSLPGRKSAPSPGSWSCTSCRLLFETGYADMVDRSVLVVAPLEERIRRVMARDLADEPSVRARIAAQIDPDAARARADYVIENDGEWERFAAANSRCLRGPDLSRQCSTNGWGAPSHARWASPAWNSRCGRQARARSASSATSTVGRSARIAMHVDHGTGVWRAFVPDAGEGARYKYAVCAGSGEWLPLKADPYAFAKRIASEYGLDRHATAARRESAVDARARRDAESQRRDVDLRSASRLMAARSPKTAIVF